MSWERAQHKHNIRRESGDARSGHSTSANLNRLGNSDVLEDDFGRRDRGQEQCTLNPFSGECDKRDSRFR